MGPAQRARLHAALLAAFTIDELRRLVRYTLDLDLDTITTGDLNERVFGVVEHAERTGRLAELIAGAVKINPGNEQIQMLVADTIAVGIATDKRHSPDLKSGIKMTDDRTNERLDQVINKLGELSGLVSMLQGQLAALRADVDRLHYPHSQPVSVHYWTVVSGFVIAAIIIAATMFYIGAPR